MLIHQGSEALSAVNTQTLNCHPVVTYLAQLVPASQKGMLHWLNAIALMISKETQDAQAFDWGSLRYSHCIVIRNQLVKKVDADEYAPATANLILSALKGVLKECWRLQLMTAEDYQRAIDFKQIKFTAIPAGRSLSESEVNALWQVCMIDPTSIGVRDVALLAILRTGVRRDEVTNLDLKDLDRETGALKIRWGKGRKSRITYVAPGSLEHIERWLKLRGMKSGPLLLPFRKGGKVEFRRISAQTVWDILAKRGAEARLEYFTPHDLRRTFVTDLYEAGVDTPTIQGLVGHANPSTTMAYDRRGEETKRKAVERLYIPRKKRPEEST